MLYYITMEEKQEDCPSRMALVVKQGYLKKLKTMKKKFFVLKSEAPENSARLEYYDSEKKWKSNTQPKRVIPLKSCFNITRRLDTRQKHVIALYTKEECMCVVLDGEEELATWLQALLSLLHGDAAPDDSPHPRQHVWQVNVQKKGLGASRNIVGLYNLCLTDRTVSLVKIRPTNNVIPHDMRATDTVEFSLIGIRRCGDSECFFYMEVGRSSVTGAGELWMHTEDPNIAQSMHATILHAMSTGAIKDDFGPKLRKRALSANEASKPISVLARRQTHTGTKPHALSPSSAGSGIGIQCARERCDSLPSRAPISGTPLPITSVLHQRAGHATVGTGSTSRPLGRPHSMYSSRGISHSPPNANSPLSPHSDSAGSSISIDETDSSLHHMISDDSHHMIGRLMNSRTPDERVIPEEAADDPHCPWQPELVDGLDRMSLHCGSPGARDPHRDQPPRKESICESSDVSSPVSITGATTGTSPQESGGYMPMSPASMEAARMIHSRAGGTPGGHSRTSSVADENVPTLDINLGLPLHTTDDGYVDMLPSGEAAPSTELRFPEFHLEKVTVSYFMPSEEGEVNRPTRAHSVGSRPEHVKKVITRQDTSDAARARAFSVGSKSKNHKERVLSYGGPPSQFSQQLPGAVRSGSVSCSAPLLAGAGINHTVGTPSRHLYGSSHGSAEPLDDLMEMDFTNSGDSPSAPATPVAIPLGSSGDSRLSLSVPTDTRKPASDGNGYMDMSPGGVNSAIVSYVEMKPTERAGSGNSTPGTDWSCGPPADAVDLQLTQPAPEGYVEMSCDNFGSVIRSSVKSRVSSLPIAINAGSPKEGKGFTEVLPAADPGYGAAPRHRGDQDPYEIEIRRGTPSKISPGVSPVAPVTSGPFSGLRRNSKKHQRRNSKESPTPPPNHSQTIFPFSLDSPGSPVKPFEPVVPGEAPPGRKCPVDASSGTVRLSRGADAIPVDRIEPRPADRTGGRPINEAISDYMEMIPSRLSTVEETGETYGRIAVDKDTKHLINSATRESGTGSVELSDYISLNPNATVKGLKPRIPPQSSGDDTANKAKSPNGGRAFSSTKGHSFVKLSAPVSFVDGGSDIDAKENRGILSSNPLAGRTLTSAPLTKAGMNAANAGRVRAPRKPVLVISQTQPTAADFRPIAPGETEPRSTKSGSPKPIESALNRQLAGALLDSRARGDVYDSLVAQNGQPPSSRPASVNNNKCKKGSRPPSANSETSVGAARSRPSSVSSELGGTPTDSRPASVTGERETFVATVPQGWAPHYATLELDAPTERSPRLPAVPAPAYTQIDFVKSEELKNSKNFAAKSKN